MSHNIDKIYEDAVASGLIPGAALIAGDKNGNDQPEQTPSKLTKYLLTRLHHPQAKPSTPKPSENPASNPAAQTMKRPSAPHPPSAPSPP